MLQIDILRVGQCFHTRPHFKPASCGVPLGSSNHPSNVHLAWPRSMLRTLTRISSHECYARQARSVFLRRLSHYQFPLGFVQHLSGLSSHDLCVTRSHECKPRTWWIVLPYHPAWEMWGLRRVIQQIAVDIAMRALLNTAFRLHGSEIPRLRIAWKNSGPPNIIALRKMSLHKRRQDGDGGGFATTAA